MSDLAQGLYFLRPELLLSFYGFFLLLLSTLPVFRRWVGGLAALGCLLTLGVVLSFPYQQGMNVFQASDLFFFGNLMILDGMALFFKGAFLLAAILSILISLRYLDTEGVQSGEYYSLICFAVVGMMIMASGTDLLSIFVGLELMAICFYILVGYLRGNRKSNEAAMKYFLLGAFSTGVFVYGASLIYSAKGTTNLYQLAARFEQGDPHSPLLILGMILLTVSLGFKVAAVPFHMWAPDAYEGAPTAVTAFLSTASKAAAFVAFVRIYAVGFLGMRDQWLPLLAVLSVASMTLGNTSALLQDNMKRMLAYSSIAHAGYVLIGIIVMSRPEVDTMQTGMLSLMLYLMIYTFINLGAFSMVVMLRRENLAGDRVVDFSGLHQRSPMAAFAMLVFMLSLAGIPATAGFIGKYYLFAAAMKAHFAWLAVVMVLNSVVSAFYYLRVVWHMYQKPPVDSVRYAVSPGLVAAVGICLAFNLLVGIFPETLIELTRRSILMLGRAG
ncbi:MAG: NADH-quinone oxidoreductase subunit N [Acidobacteria bacterium]|nr:MAG: NADH-quinone oxidoreductase subunit N [Acidobacteriota bacterium]